MHLLSVRLPASHTTQNSITKLLLTWDIRDGGSVLNVLSRLARTPGGGSNTNTRPARSRFTGSWNIHINTRQMTMSLKNDLISQKGFVIIL